MMVAKTLSIKIICVLLNFIAIIPGRYFVFNFRRIILRTDSYCPIPSSLKKRKEKLVVVFLRPPSNVKLGNFT